MRLWLLHQQVLEHRQKLRDSFMLMPETTTGTTKQKQKSVLGKIRAEINKLTVYYTTKDKGINLISQNAVNRIFDKYRVESEGRKMILEEKEHFVEIDIKLSDGTLIGTAEIEPNEKMLERFVIFEPYQNKGYGQMVLSDLIDAYGIKKLWVRSDNERAIHVYEKAGFGRTKEKMFEMERGKK